MKKKIWIGSVWSWRELRGTHFGRNCYSLIGRFLKPSRQHQWPPIHRMPQLQNSWRRDNSKAMRTKHRAMPASIRLTESACCDLRSLRLPTDRMFTFTSSRCEPEVLHAG
jgi:hypothetical protein